MLKNLAGIRFFLFLFVFLNHIYANIFIDSIYANETRFLFLGSFAVSFFFLLSGFCIAINYSSKFEFLNIKTIKDFIFKRFIKFYPLYLITGIIFHYFHYFMINPEFIWMFLFNYIPMIGPFTNAIYGAGNYTAWFLAALFFCYFLTPIILYILNKLKNKKCFILNFILAYLILYSFSIHLNIFKLSDNYLTHLYHHPMFRLMQYTYGLFLGIFYNKFLKNYHMNIRKNILDLVILIIFFILIFIDITLAGEGAHYGKTLAFENIVCLPVFAIIILYLANQNKSFLTNLLSSKIILFLANISFECYLIHYLFVFFFKDIAIKYLDNKLDLIVIPFIFFVLTIISAILYKKFVNYLKTKTRP